MSIVTLITRLTIESNTMGSKMAGGKKKDGKLTLLRDGSHLGREKMAEKRWLRKDGAVEHKIFSISNFSPLTKPFSR